MNDKEMFRVAHATCSILQLEEEVLWALDRIRHNRQVEMERFMEIGVAAGGSLCMWGQLMKTSGLMIGVDPGGFGRLFEERMSKLLQVEFHLVNARSEEPSTLQAVKDILNGEKLDGMFVDSLHTAPQTKKEWDMYYPLLKPHAWAGFHDIIPDQPYDVPPTREFWNELKRHHRHEEMALRGGLGIGLIFL